MFIETYRKYSIRVTDAPSAFHDYLSICTAGIAIGRNRYIQFGHQRIYPNFYLIILAPSSFYRKSTALSISREALLDVDASKVFSADFTQEKIMEILKDRPCGALYYYEFKSLMGLLSRDYNTSLKSFITELYDCYPVGLERKGVSYTIENPCVSLIAATTSDWFTESIKNGDIQSGFLTRFMFVYSNKKLRDDSIPPDPDFELKKKMIEELLKISLLTEQRMVLLPEARSMYDDWYKRFIKKYELTPSSYSTLFARLNIYCLKIAIVLETCKNSTSTGISPDTMKEAILYSDWLQNATLELFRKELSFSKYESGEKKLLKILEEQGGTTTKRHLLQNCHVDIKQMNLVLDTLIEKDMIDIEFRKVEGSRKQTCFVLLKGRPALCNVAATNSI